MKQILVLLLVQIYKVVLYTLILIAMAIHGLTRGTLGSLCRLMLRLAESRRIT